ncbi:MAG TPA: nucleotidyltransferase family protein [bacterium]|nr:nucleotidyltransferase family protein [bacterium]
MLLAAGLGTRLRPLTDRIPKCMVRVDGRPLLEHTLSWLRSYGVRDVVINLHHLPDVVRDYFGDGGAYGVRITYSYEAELLGTAGAVKRVASCFDGPFFVWYGDNLSTCRLDRLWEFHRARRGLGTVALFHREDPAHSGIVAVDDDGRIRRFVEKPRPGEIFSHWVNAGILVLEPGVLDEIPATGLVDFGRDVFPALLARGEALYGYRMSHDEGLWWIDRPQDLALLERIWPTVSRCPGDAAAHEG